MFFVGFQYLSLIHICPTVIVAPITSRIHTKAKLPTHTLINDFEGLDKNSIILLEQIRTIDKQRLKQYLGDVYTRQQVRTEGTTANASLAMPTEKQEQQIKNLEYVKTVGTQYICLLYTSLLSFSGHTVQIYNDSIKIQKN